MLGPVKGCAIKIDPQVVVADTLSIGEGLETVLSGRAMGFVPAWAVGSAGAIAAFPVVPGVERLRIFGEVDGGASAKAITSLRAQWAGRKISVVMPRDGCGDLNEEWVKHKDDPSDFLEICQRFWPGAEIGEGEARSDTVVAMKKIGLAAFGIGGRDGD
jgi:Toprim domain